MTYLILFAIAVFCISLLVLAITLFVYCTAWMVVLSGVLLIIGVLTFRKEVYSIQEYFIPSDTDLRKKLLQDIRSKNERGLHATWRESDSIPEESFWVAFRVSDEMIHRQVFEQMLALHDIPTRLGEKISSHYYTLFWGLMRIEKDEE